MIKFLLNNFICLLLHLVFLFLKFIRKKNSIVLSSFVFGLLGPLTKLNKRAEINLKYIWPTFSEKKRKIICKNMWQNLGRNFGEFIFLQDYDPLKCMDTKIIGLNYAKTLIAKNKKKKKGVIFFSAHFGNWEIGPYIINKLNVDLMGIYRKSNNICIDKIIQKYRNKDTFYVPKGDMGAKKSYLWLRKGKSLALLMDQKLNEGMCINFLKKPANTATAIAELAVRMDLDVVPIKILRKNDFGHEIKFVKKLSAPKQTFSHEIKVKYIQ